MLNEKYILEIVKPYLNSKRQICERDFEKLFSDMERTEQYEIINIMIGAGIEYVDDDFSTDIDCAIPDDMAQEIECSSFNESSELLPQQKLRKRDRNYSLYDVKQLIPLKNEQLCQFFQDGNQMALDALIEKNQRFVYQNALFLQKQYRQYSLTTEDLVQYGNLGLIEAAKRFEIKKGFAFLTYADYWIKQSITRNIADYAFMIRLPVHVMEKVRHIWKIRNQNPGLTENELIEKIKESGYNGTSSKIRDLMKYGDIYLNTTSLNVLVGEDGETELQDFIPAETTVEDISDLDFLRDNLNRLLDTLTDREATVIRMRFGLDDGIPHTLEEVGESYNLTRERIRQIENKALRKLRHPSRAKLIRDFYKDVEPKKTADVKQASPLRQKERVKQVQKTKREDVCKKDEIEYREDFAQKQEIISMVTEQEFERELQRVSEFLSDKERTIFCMRAGLDFGIQCTAEELKEKYGVSAEEVRKVELHARHLIASKYRDEFDRKLNEGIQ